MAKRILLQVEGGTCSGKSTFVKDIGHILNSCGIPSKVVDESARKVFNENPTLFGQLCSLPPDSRGWKQAKKESQLRILSEQISELHKLSYEGSFVSIMDRGGASTAFHGITVLSDLVKPSFEDACKKITKAAHLIFLLPQLGFLYVNSNRYQTMYEDTMSESNGIKWYLDRWKISYVEILPTDRFLRNIIGVYHILKLLQKSQNSSEF
jgi:hypothetical protein